MAIEMGSTYRDKVTGFTGVCTGYVQYITGCNQALLVPKCKKDGTLNDAEWFDEQRLENVKASRVVVDNSAAKGFDKQAPKR